MPPSKALPQSQGTAANQPATWKHLAEPTSNCQPIIEHPHEIRAIDLPHTAPSRSQRHHPRDSHYSRLQSPLQLRAQAFNMSDLW